MALLEDGPSCATFLAKTDTEETVVAKFRQEYNEHAHRCLADHGMAPRLRYFRFINKEDMISMIVMDHIEGRRLSDYMLKHKYAPDDERKQLNTALALLHEHNFVLGAIDTTALIIDQEGKVKLTDFTWTGLEGQTLHPPTWFTGADESYQGVVSHLPVEKKHDQKWADFHFPPKSPPSPF